jgi:cation diffusion facilitator CzcD-associated flavoprotein CzcO
VIGAGPSGITAAKNLLQVGLPSVFETTHIISSRTLSQYSDYPWPPGSPD